MNSMSRSNDATSFGSVASVPELRPIADRILEEVRRAPNCELDALALGLPEISWQDVVREVHRLCSTRQLQLSPWGAGIYTVSA